MKIKVWRVLFLVLTLAIMVIIFAFSAQSAEVSGNVSEGVARSLLPFLEGADADVIQHFNQIIRKCAHAFIYALLGGFAAAFALSCHRQAHSGAMLAVMGWGFALLYAVSDELHQMFVPGRGPAVTDVLIDAGGAAMGAAVAALIWSWQGKNKN